MPDLLVTADVQAAQATANIGERFVRTDEDTAYMFVLDSTFRIAMWKTINKGMAWVQTIIDGPAADRPTVWYDRWTPGLTGRNIYLIYYVNGDTVYRVIDTTTDTVGAVNTLYNGVHPADTPRVLGITVSRSGLIFSAAESNSAGLRDRFWRGTTERANPWDGPSDHILLCPGNEPDADDVYTIYWDRSANEITLKFFDNSLNTWTETIVIAAATDGSTKRWGRTIRHSDNAIFLIFWNLLNDVLADLECVRIDDRLTATSLGNVVTDVGTIWYHTADIMMDQQSGRLYAFYGYGPGNFLQDVVYKLSANGGLGWGAEWPYSTTQDHWWAVHAAVSADDLGGAAAPAMLDEGGDDWYTNRDNGTFFPPPPVVPPIIPPPPEIVPPGGSYEPSPGAPPGTVVAITPDGLEFELMSPGIGELSGASAYPGRYVMTFSGFGLAPIQYVTQRGPNQDGETVRDFHLTPRVIQLLERAQFRSRSEWWNGRADLLNDLRPNRQLTETATEPFKLRIVTSNGALRDLNVFIQDGPRFEPRNVDEWDEWAFEEVLRFVAHDPLWFDPTRVDFTLAFVLDTDLVFPITFPIEFGGGVIDVSVNLDYVGTWASLPTIVIVGPIDNPIIDNVTTGETIGLAMRVGPARTVTIDLAFGAKTVTDDLGANLLSFLMVDSNLGTFHIAATPEAPQVVGQPRPTGRNVIRLRGSNPTGSTSVQVRYFTRYFGI